MADEWHGDGTYVLPLRKVEPYRLWFEFLKLADRDPDITVDDVFYEDWGDFRTQSFSDWWRGATWRTLFAIDGGVSVIQPTDTIQSNDPISSLMVRIPLGKSVKDSLKDVKALLEENGATDQMSASPKGRYSLIDGVEKGFMKKMGKARLMLRLYEYWLDSADADGKNRYNFTANAYYDWATHRDSMILEKGWNYPRPEMPDCIEYYVLYALWKVPIPEQKSEKMTNDWIRATDRDDNLRQIKRLISRSRKLSVNAAKGQFPKYT
jgi:hypothetical protein